MVVFPRGLASNTINLWVAPGWLAAINPRFLPGSVNPDFCLDQSTPISAWVCRPWFLPGLLTLISAWSVDPYFCWGLSILISTWSFFLPGSFDLDFCLGLSTPTFAWVYRPQFLPGLLTLISAWVSQPWTPCQPGKTRSTQNTTHTPNTKFHALPSVGLSHVLLLLMMSMLYSLSFD